MDYIFSRLALGNVREAQADPPVDAILNISEFHYPTTRIYRYLYFPDGVYIQPLGLIGECTQFIHEQLRSGGRVLVHCAEGISRSCVIGAADEVRALNAIHQGFFETRTRLALVVIGVGNVGSAVLRQLHQQRQYLLSKGFDVSVVGLANSKRFAADAGGINLSKWKDVLDASPDRMKPEAFARRMPEVAIRYREITTNELGMASGVVYYDPNGAERFQPAEVVIVAANGVGTPRLLLNSASSRFPNGLANSSGLVGKNLMLHPWPVISGYVGEPMDGGRGPITCMWSKQFYETDTARGFVRGYTLQFGRSAGPATEAITSAAAGRLPWGRDHHRVYRALLDRRLNIGVACEDLPEALGAELGRHFGPRAAKPDRIVEGEWASRQWTRGCYNANTGPCGLIHFGEARSKPIGPIKWAATETANAWSGYMEGAVEAGRRAAREALADL